MRERDNTPTHTDNPDAKPSRQHTNRLHFGLSLHIITTHQNNMSITDINVCRITVSRMIVNGRSRPQNAIKRTKLTVWTGTFNKNVDEIRFRRLENLCWELGGKGEIFSRSYNRRPGSRDTFSLEEVQVYKHLAVYIAPFDTYDVQLSTSSLAEALDGEAVRNLTAHELFFFFL
jgi:hypothetical protein